MEIYITNENHRVIVWVNKCIIVDIWKTLNYPLPESYAIEAAEILKAFFEAKEAGKVARLVVESDLINAEPTKIECLGDRCVADGECEKRALCWFDPANEWKSTPIPEIMLEGERHKNTVIDQMNEEEPNAYERYARQQIAHNATQIFAHVRLIDREDAVNAAAEIWRLSYKIEL